VGKFIGKAANPFAEALRQVPVDSIESTAVSLRNQKNQRSRLRQRAEILPHRLSRVLSEMDAQWSWKVTKRRNHKCSTNANSAKPYRGVKGVRPPPCHYSGFPAVFRVKKSRLPGMHVGDDGRPSASDELSAKQEFEPECRHDRF
jgi:hypothetical protein